MTFQELVCYYYIRQTEERVVGKRLTRLQQRANFLLCGHACYLVIVLKDEQVYFAAYAEFGQVNSGLDGATGASQQHALIPRLEIGKIGRVRMRDKAEPMAGASL